MNALCRHPGGFPKIRQTRRALSWLGSALCLGITTAAQAQSATPVHDDGLTFHGITLSGTVDIGVQHDSHGAPESDYYQAGTNAFIVKQNNGAITAMVPSGLSQSKVALSGNEPINAEFAGVFKLETAFNPTSGNISNALKSLTINNGVALASQTMSADSSYAGQVFNSAAYAGIASRHFGTITFGRQTSLIADGVSTYDPMAGALAFSIIGFSGTFAGGGDTEDRRFDSSIKYLVQIDHLRAGALYKFSQTGGEANTAASFQLGAAAGNGTIDFYYQKVRSAVSAAALSAAQVTGLAVACPGCAPGTTLSGTISDNTAFSAMGSYKVKPVKLFGAYEHIEYRNPASPLNGATGGAYTTIGGYTLPYAFLNQAAYTNPKKLDVFWLGAQATVTAKLAVWAAYYNSRQNSYATGASAGCTTSASSGCSGDLQAFSAVGVFGVNRHFDVYAGFMASNVTNGYASGYLHTREFAPTSGARLRF
jgi:predicted porin